MRMIIVKQPTDLQALSERLLGKGSVSKVVLQSLERLNPHVDFGKIEAGTVLLVPDVPGLRKGESAPVSAEAFEEFQQQIMEGLDAAVARVNRGYETLGSQRKELSAILKPVAVKRILEGDADLMRQLDEATEVSKSDQQRAKEAEKTLQVLRHAKMELALLAKRLG